ncbi:MAG: MBL fold metallo-hydrolase [Candidatus Heimdallarchaeota archaeon]
MKYEKFGENIYVMKDELFFDVVVGAIELPTKLIMIDTGMNLRKIKEFKEEVEKVTKKKFETVFLTHYHGDHIIGNQHFSDCDIIGSKWTVDRLNIGIPKWTDEVIEQQKKRIDDPLAFVGLELTPANKSFEGQLEIVDDNVKIIVKQTGGHTKGSSYIYCPNYKVLFGGDNLFIDSYPWGGEETCDPDKWINTLKEYLSMDVKYFVPGHGPVSDKEPLKYILAYFELVKSTILEMASKGKTEEEIIKKCYDLDFYPIDETQKDHVEMKELTLKKWYNFWVNSK